MPRKVSAYNVHSVYGAPYRQVLAISGGLQEGLFVGLNTGGEIILADYRTAQGKPGAVGVLLQSAQRKDALGNVMRTEHMGSYTREGKIAGLTGLVPGTFYFLSSGGAVQVAKPGGAGDLAQIVGYAETTTTLVIALGDPAVQ